ncbi:hypothetical protein ACFWIN_37030 [Streptomyces sp. NPDC127049]|uniref:hypothetical protein n=1 Tax=Streptomyces sp. NPDC127049 TaxID=3347118 RepID=UPI0036646A50
MRGLGLLYGVEVAAGSLSPLMRGARSGASSYPFTGAGESKTQGLVVAPPLTSTDDDTDLLLTALGEAVTSPT